MKLAIVEGERREAQPGLSAECPACGAAMIAKCGPDRVWHGRIGDAASATFGGNLKQNGIALGKTAFPRAGRK